MWKPKNIFIDYRYLVTSLLTYLVILLSSIYLINLVFCIIFIFVYLVFIARYLLISNGDLLFVQHSIILY